jgi:hypothetical protein
VVISFFIVLWLPNDPDSRPPPHSSRLARVRPRSLTSLLSALRLRASQTIMLLELMLADPGRCPRRALTVARVGAKLAKAATSR